MKIRLMMTVLCVLAAPATLNADIYRCEMPDGRILFGDKPVNLSDACQPVKEASSGEEGSPLPKATSRPAAEAALINRTPGGKKPVEADPDGWAARATALVDAYKEARKKRTSESYLVNKRKALAEMAQLCEEKALLLEDMANNTLNTRQRERVRVILNEIPE